MKTLILISVMLHVSLMSICQTYSPVPEGNPLEDARKSLNGALAMSLTSCLAQGLGYIGTLSATEGNYDEDEIELQMMSWLVGIGGIGMQTNTPILISRAKRQIKKWDCPPEDVEFKQKMRAKIGAAQTVSIIRTVLPAVGFMAMRVFVDDEDGSENAKNVFYGFWAASLILTIPEIVLIETANNEIKSYQNRLQLSPTKEGLGFIYHF